MTIQHRQAHSGVTAEDFPRFYWYRFTLHTSAMFHRTRREKNFRPTTLKPCVQIASSWQLLYNQNGGLQQVLLCYKKSRNASPSPTQTLYNKNPILLSFCNRTGRGFESRSEESHHIRLLYNGYRVFPEGTAEAGTYWWPTHFHQLPILRIYGAAPPLRLYSFIGSTGANLPFLITYSKNVTLKILAKCPSSSKRDKIMGTVDIMYDYPQDKSGSVRFAVRLVQAQVSPQSHCIMRTARPHIPVGYKATQRVHIAVMLQHTDRVHSLHNVHASKCKRIKSVPLSLCANILLQTPNLT